MRLHVLALFIAAFSVSLIGGSQSELLGQQRGKKKKPAAKPKLPRAERTPPPHIAAVRAETLDRVLVGAKKIDQLVEKNYAKYSVKPNAMTSDEQFVRRVYLDITGTVPTYQQARTFLQSRSTLKRQQLIDRLLNSPGYASHFYNYWGNILRLADRPQPNVFARPYNDWVKKAIRDNMPYDKFVTEMLTAEGKAWENPPAGYFLRDAGMPLARVDNTVRVFLGTRIGCAQCHDHPFDHWTQKQFYEVASLMYGVRTRVTGRDGIYKNGNPINRVRDEMKRVDPKSGGNGTFVRLMRANTYAVVNDDKRQLKLPHDYSYDNGKPNQLVKPSVLFAGEGFDPGNSPRQSMARWMTSPENPRFALTLANRLWKRALGVGVIEPVDDLRDESEPENEELMKYLVKVLTFIDYDMKEFQRIIYNTQTYQRQARIQEPQPEEVYHFPGPTLRRMTAEQVWDSLLTLAVYRPDGIARSTALDAKEVLDVDLNTVTADEMKKRTEAFEARWGRAAARQERQDFGYKGLTLMRASELQMPLPPDHFLRQFGQGDRELISGSSADGSVPQILTMFNGPVTHMMLEKGSVIYDNVVKAKTSNERLDVIFLSVLGRRPTKSDRQLSLAEIKSGGNAGYGNVIWALINTREFLFIQ